MKTENADIVRETMLKHEMHANFTTLQQFHKPLLQNKPVTFITTVLIKKSYLESQKATSQTDQLPRL